MGNLILVRHGESEHNAQKLICGDEESPLTELGREQARQVAQQLPSDVQHVFVSPLERAQATWKLVAEVKGYRHEPITVPELRERHLGNIVNQPETTYSKEQWLAWKTWSSHPPEGESYADVAKRMLPWLSATALPLAAQGTVLIFAHNAVFKIMRTFLENRDPEKTRELDMPPAGTIWYEVDADQTVHLRSASELPANQQI